MCKLLPASILITSLVGKGVGGYCASRKSSIVTKSN
jgi:hypothetical protein